MSIYIQLVGTEPLPPRFAEVLHIASGAKSCHLHNKGQAVSKLDLGLVKLSDV